MGGGSYSLNDARTRSATHYKGKSSREIFTKKNMDNAMNPKGIKIRESRDSEEHPESIAIITGLDVTGSMGHIPKHMITEGLTQLMGTIIQRGVKDPQVLFLGIGDHECDRAPLQVSQFESSDELLDKWLKDVYLEGGGGGNAGESYALAWYFAANHTAIDCWQKRAQKGFLFTIGDEPTLKHYPKAAIESLMGETSMVQEKEVQATDLLKMARERYHVRHLHLTETPSGARRTSQGDWRQLMQNDVIFVDDHEKIPVVMAKEIIKTLGVADNVTTEEIDKAADQIINDNKDKDEVVL